MRLIGLTGSIATGKSTCSQILSSPPHSLPIIDADLLARRAVEPGSWGYRQILSTFGPTTPDLLLPASDPASGGEHGPNGKGRPLNRPALGRRVFGSSPERAADRKKLNRIIHPIVRFYMWRSVMWYWLMGHWAVVLDIPLLFESGLDIFCSTVLVVAVSEPKVQMERLMSRDSHLSRDDAEDRVGSQVDVREKARRALLRNGNVSRDGGVGAGDRGYVVYNDGSKEDLKLQVEEVVRRMKERSPSWWTVLLWVCPVLTVGLAGWEVGRNWWVKRGLEKDRGAELPKAKL